MGDWCRRVEPQGTYRWAKERFLWGSFCRLRRPFPLARAAGLLTTRKFMKIHENSCDQIGRLRGIVPYSGAVGGLETVRPSRTSVE